MDKFEFLLNSINNGYYKRKNWIISVFSIVRYDNQVLNNSVLGCVYHLDDGPAFVNSEFKLEPLSKAVANQVLFYPLEAIHLKNGDILNADRDLDTTVGNVIANAMVFIYPFGSKIPFIAGKFKAKEIEGMIVSKLSDNESNDTVTVEELLKFTEAVGALTGFATLIVPTGSAKTFTIDPAIIKRRNELLKEYGDKVKDPAIMAKIEKELTTMDRASFKGDISEGFLINNDAFDIARKKMFIMSGLELSFNHDTAPVKVSLNDGLQVANVPAVFEAVRAGAYGRGKETELGGEQVKFFSRVYQNTRVSESDCKTKMGLNWKITERNFKNFVGLYLTDNPKEPITIETIQSYMGKSVSIRSPLYCNTIAPCFCAKCVGDAYALNPNGLITAASAVGSVMMGWFMKKNHGIALKTTHLDWSEALL